MGYSCSAIAAEIHHKMLEVLQRDSTQNHYSSNTWDVKGVHYFDERGRENRDRAITGTIQRNLLNGYAKRAGSYRIDRDGKIVRWPSSTAAQREEAEKAGRTEYHRRFPRVISRSQAVEIMRQKHREAWQKALAFDNIEDGPFVILSEQNPYAEEVNIAAQSLQQVLAMP